MTETDRQAAEMVFRRLCEGAQIDGIRFGPVLQLLITNHSSATPSIRGQVCLNLVSPWVVVDGSPAGIPETPDLPVDEQLRVLCGLREKTIERVEVRADVPHLLLGLAGGTTLIIRADDEDYESWNLGVAFADPSAPPHLVVAGPGSRLTVWAPDDVVHESASRRTRG